MQSVASVADESLEQALDFDALEAAFELEAGAAMRAACRAVLARVNERLEQRFFGGAPVEEIVGLRAFCIDELIRRAWFRIGPGDCPHALLAVGGYGRGELHPYSDVDICIVLGSELDERTRGHIEHLIGFLWDIGLEVGHSVRTIEECVQAARDDITIMTNLMEARLVEGPPALFAALRTATANDRLWPTDLFFKAKMEEQERRHQRYNDAFQQLEPNIKESPGGLRDIQLIAWV
ncbi:MAG: nucleotidyltransferase domain-containing protein, partial [Gammaproteobacteria bacterium]